MKKKSIIIIVVIAIIAIVGVLAYISTADLREAVKLRGEASKLSKMDVAKDDVDMEIKTTGDYAIIEQTMKEYMNKYSINIKEIAKILDDEKLTQVLTAENYEKDGPDFVETKSYINETRESFNEKINTLIEMTSKEAIEKAIEGKNLSENLVDLYKELMLGEEMSSDFEETVESLKSSSQTINNILDVQENIINMLIANKNRWMINKDGEIEFSTQKLVDEYNSYLQSL